MNDSKKPSSQGTREVVVDLGDDLLEDSPAISHPSLESTARAPVDAQVSDSFTSQKVDVVELLESAEILRKEGFPRDAKKVLHQVLIRHPGHLRAQTLLADLQNAELKEILEDRDPVRSARISRDFFSEEEDPDALLRKLDQELQLGLFRVLDHSEAILPEGYEDSGSELSENLIREVEQKCSGLSVSDLTDLGIGFLEMELSQVATYLFTRASLELDPDHPEGQLLSRSIIGLLALSLLHQGRAYEAFFHLQPLVSDFEIRNEDKLELFYLLGRAYELMNKNSLAFEFYLQVWSIDPQYRDVERRLRKKSKSK